MMDAGHLGELSLESNRFLANRVERLRHVFRHHLRWEHELAVRGGDAFVLQWLDAQGQWQLAVIDSVFLDIHHALLNSLIADLATSDPRGRALANSVRRELLKAFEDEQIR